MFKLRKLRPTQQVRVLLVFSGIASALNVALAVFVVVKGFRPLSYSVEVNPPSQIDLSFLDAITNRPCAADVSVISNAAESSRQSPLQPLPVEFDGYCEVNGVPYAVFRGHSFKVGDFLNGRMVESISPWAVVVQGQVYAIIKREKGVLNERVPTPSPALPAID